MGDRSNVIKSIVLQPQLDRSNHKLTLEVRIKLQLNTGMSPNQIREFERNPHRKIEVKVSSKSKHGVVTDNKQLSHKFLDEKSQSEYRLVPIKWAEVTYIALVKSLGPGESYVITIGTSSLAPGTPEVLVQFRLVWVSFRNLLLPDAFGTFLILRNLNDEIERLKHVQLYISWIQDEKASKFSSSGAHILANIDTDNTSSLSPTHTLATMTQTTALTFSNFKTLRPLAPPTL